MHWSQTLLKMEWKWRLHTTKGCIRKRKKKSGQHGATTGENLEAKKSIPAAAQSAKKLPGTWWCIFSPRRNRRKNPHIHVVFLRRPAEKDAPLGYKWDSFLFPRCSSYWNVMSDQPWNSYCGVYRAFCNGKHNNITNNILRIYQM